MPGRSVSTSIRQAGGEGTTDLTLYAKVGRKMKRLTYAVGVGFVSAVYGPTAVDPSTIFRTCTAAGRQGGRFSTYGVESMPYRPMSGDFHGIAEVLARHPNIAEDSEDERRTALRQDIALWSVTAS